MATARKFDPIPPREAVARFNAALDDAWRAAPALGNEVVRVANARDRVLARDVTSPMNLPEFRRSSVDGYAVRASDTPGALRIVGAVNMGEVSSLRVNAGESAQVPTGGFVPDGADAVLMIEHTRPVDNTTRIETDERLSPGDNVIALGEDLRAGDAALQRGTRLREQEIAGLLSLGIVTVEVVRQPRVAVIPSGDELVSPDADVKPGQIRQTNSPMLAALVRRNGGVPIEFEALRDQRDAFEAAAARAMREADAIVFVAASSVGERDFVPDVVNGMGAPGIVAHGIAFRPGKPALFAVAKGKPVFGLPGNPISALVTATFFVAPALWHIQGATNPPRPSVVRATLAADVRSPRDLEHWFPVRLERGDGDTPSARAISTKSNLIFGLVRADGLACAPIGVDRLSAGSEIDVRLVD